MAVAGVSAWLFLSSSGYAQTTSRNAQQQKSSAEREQADLRERLRNLKNELARSEAHRAEARDALQKSEAAISQTNRRLRELAQEQQVVRERLDELQVQRQQVQVQVQSERHRLADLVRAQYLGERASQWQLFLQGENPHRTARNLAYLGYFARAQADSIQRLDGLASHLATLAQTEKNRQQELDRLASEELKTRQQLETEKRLRASTLEKIARQIQNQRREVGALEKDAARLNNLITRLDQLLAEERRKQELRRRQSAQRAPRTNDKNSARPGKAAPTEPTFEGHFAALRGQLRLPVQGALAGRFGQPREGGKTTWKGIYIRKNEGAEVQAIAAGRVVFSDWLRGFGNLLIIDHGDQYLSIYAGNESLFKQTGQEVKAREPIASVGNTLGIGEPGLYFEMRYRGTPFDPLNWVK